MKPTQIFFAAAAVVSLCFGPAAMAADPQLSIQPGVELSWATTLGNTYQLQAAPVPAGPWANLTGAVPGDGQPKSHTDFSTSGSRHFRVLETVPGIPAPPVNPVNGGFESGTGTTASKWTTGASQPPTRISSDARSGSYSMRCSVVNVGSAAAEGLLNQMVVAQGGAVTGGQTYKFSFWIKQVSSGPSYIQQYEVQWLNSTNGYLGGTGLQNFNRAAGPWEEITVPNLVAPTNAVEARVSFRFVTGAVTGGFGEVLLDDISLTSGSGSTVGTPDTVNTLPVASKRVAKISWPSKTGMSYRPVASTNFVTWTPLQPLIDGDGSTKQFTVPMTKNAEFFRLEMPIAVVLPPVNLQTTAAGGANSIGLAWSASPTTGVTGYRILYGTSSGNLDQSVDVGNVTSAFVPNLIPGQTYFLSVVAITVNGESLPGGATISAIPNADSGIVALYNSSTVPEAATTVNTSTSLITRLADRARDRHAREAQFNSYDHYLSWYWEQRMANIEIIDRIGKAGQPQNITFNYTTQDLLNPAEFRTFFRGIGTVAEYNNNQIATLVSSNPSATPGETDYNYRATITQNANEGNRALRVGDRVEIEISLFLNGPRNGRLNYYGTTLLYIVGQGIVPWAQGNDLGFPIGIVGNVNRTLDSHPLPTSAWLGGLTTLPYQYSDEPEHRFKQLAGNISPTNGQPFMLGRRLHHTDFGNGVHSESGNPVFSPHIGKLGPKFIARSCVECHVNNGRALPPDIGAPMLQSVVKVGSNATGSPHPQLGSVLQPRSTSGPVEATATIANYTNLIGQFGDGTSYSLRKPNYAFQGVTPSHFSVRLTPPLVGMGLLEAVAESTITALADPADANQDGISGRLQKITDPQTGDQRLGRFTNKAGSARVSHQVASALNTDMGVTTPVFPSLDGETTAGPPEISTAELDQMTRYIALLGIGARRDLADPQALRGEQVFASSQCVKCHTP
ncbi:MAG: di-heme oxidoredictase family protein, partial [Luteolibacter sp.]